MSKGPDTSACSIVMSFLVMNLMKWLKVIFYALFIWLTDMAEGGHEPFYGAKKEFCNYLHVSIAHAMCGCGASLTKSRGPRQLFQETLNSPFRGFPITISPLRVLHHTSC